MVWAGPLLKPSRLTRDIEKHERRQARASMKRQADKAVADAWEAKRLEIYTRDKGCSRASGRELLFKSDNPFKVADVNHIQLRSAGGPDESWNLCILSREEHDMFHGKHHVFLLEISGDADMTLSFTKLNRETGRIVQQWMSPNPSL